MTNSLRLGWLMRHIGQRLLRNELLRTTKIALPEKESKKILSVRQSTFWVYLYRDRIFHLQITPFIQVDRDIGEIPAIQQECQNSIVIKQAIKGNFKKKAHNSLYTAQHTSLIAFRFLWYTFCTCII
ncbi:hypothetical protein F8M41_000919 [Gigaspora margarita]|uniref:Uncharacterized protein n=1 Tax=Gigaspora margarita TaxID=4874 RepID=A0A8H3XH67_GIGMA|nr:hypothetical protein F8M41_000919 [Gigaspora margarita]